MSENKKLIIDAVQHNCSHCGTKSANYTNIQFVKIDENDDKCLYAMFVTCCVCNKVSMHLLKNIKPKYGHVDGVDRCGDFYSGYQKVLDAAEIAKIDENIIMSIPTPSFIIDNGIPKNLRDLLIEALKCIKENALTGASACIRKAIYEFLKKENASGNNYDEKIKSIKNQWFQLADYFDVVKGIKGITSDQVHEDSFSKFTSEDAQIYISVLEEIFREVYVIPEQRKARKEKILGKFAAADKSKKETLKNTVQKK